MATEIAIPWQSLTTKTIKEAKHGLYTYCCRLMLKLCAKIGGEPWAVSDLPYFTQLSIAIGVHVTDNQVCAVVSLN